MKKSKACSIDGLATSQATERGWAHLSRQAIPQRSSLIVSTRNALAHIAANAQHLYPLLAQPWRRRVLWIPPQIVFGLHLGIHDEVPAHDGEVLRAGDEGPLSDSHDSSMTSSHASSEGHAELHEDTDG